MIVAPPGRLLAPHHATACGTQRIFAGRTGDLRPRGLGVRRPWTTARPRLHHGGVHRIRGTLRLLARDPPRDAVVVGVRRGCAIAAAIARRASGDGDAASIGHVAPASMSDAWRAPAAIHHGRDPCRPRAPARHPADAKRFALTRRLPSLRGLRRSDSEQSRPWQAPAQRRSWPCRVASAMRVRERPAVDWTPRRCPLRRRFRGPEHDRWHRPHRLWNRHGPAGNAYGTDAMLLLGYLARFEPVSMLILAAAIAIVARASHEEAAVAERCGLAAGDVANRPQIRLGLGGSVGDRFRVWRSASSARASWSRRPARSHFAHPDLHHDREYAAVTRGRAGPVAGSMTIFTPIVAARRAAASRREVR